MSAEDRADAAKALRQVADFIESDSQTTLVGSLEAKRWIPVSRQEIDNWVESSMVYRSPLDQDRTQTTTLTFDIQPDLP